MTPEQFERQIKKDLRATRRLAKDAIARTARKAVKIVRNNTPHAFGELQDSIYAESRATIVSAPHAQAVEVGSRPHLVPLEVLLKWVKLRGTQGLTATGRVVRKQQGWKGPTSREHARNVAGQLNARVEGGALDIDAPEQIAKSIQMAILKNGTKPQWFVQKSLPEVMALLDNELRNALMTVDRHYY